MPNGNYSCNQRRHNFSTSNSYYYGTNPNPNSYYQYTSPSSSLYYPPEVTKSGSLPPRPKSHIIYTTKYLKYQRPSVGTTALRLARESIERLKEKNDQELYGLIHQQVKNEFYKKKMADKNWNKNIRFQIYQNRLYERKEKELNERLKRDNESLNCHYALTDYEEKMLQKRNNKIINKHQMKEEDVELLRKRNYEINENLIRNHKEKENEYQIKFNKLMKEDQLKRFKKDQKMKIKDEEVKINLNLRQQNDKYNRQQKFIEKQNEIDYALEVLKKKRKEFDQKWIDKDMVHERQVEDLRIRQKDENEKKKRNTIERFEDHKIHMDVIKNIEKRKNENYFIKQNIKEEKMYEKGLIKQQISNENKQISEQKEKYMQNNILNVQKQNDKWRQKVQNKINERENIAEELFNNRDQQIQLKNQEIHEKYKMKELEINDLRYSEEQYLLQKKNWLDNRMRQIEEFINEKHIINQEKNRISDDLAIQKQMYSNQIGEIFYNKEMDRRTMGEIHQMLSNNQQLVGIIPELKKEKTGN